MSNGLIGLLMALFGFVMGSIFGYTIRKPTKREHGYNHIPSDIPYSIDNTSSTYDPH